MKKYFLIIFVLFLSNNVNSNESLLTIQQQLERLQREVSDLSQSVFSNSNNTSSNQNNELITNLSAIDMRIYDLEKDVKNLTGSIEEIFFQLEDLVTKVNNFQNTIISLENSISSLRNNNSSNITNENNGQLNNNIVEEEVIENNTLGSLKITSEDNLKEEKEDKSSETKTPEENLSPEDQFQNAFDNIRNKNWEDAKISLLEFIKNNPNNQLSGSAHYWLGELHILEKKFREAALIFAEGYQKFPKSIKAPDMLFKLSQSLYEVNKLEESCKTLEKFILDYPKNKFVKAANKQILEYGCLNSIE